MIEPVDKQIPIRRQCELLGLHRSTLYYQPRGGDAFNERLMRLIDEQYVRTPFYGVEQMRLHLNRELAAEGVTVNAKRVRRLMRLMGLEAIYPKRHSGGLSRPDKAHRVYPYLLKGLTIDRPDHVWCTDITYIRLRRGWVYLVPDPSGPRLSIPMTEEMVERLPKTRLKKHVRDGIEHAKRIGDVRWTDWEITGKAQLDDLLKIAKRTYGYLTETE